MKTFTFIIYLKAICCVFAIYSYDESTKITNDGIVESSHLYRKKSSHEDVEFVPHRLRQVKDEIQSTKNSNRKIIKGSKNEISEVHPYIEFQVDGEKFNNIYLEENFPPKDIETRLSDRKYKNIPYDNKFVSKKVENTSPSLENVLHSHGTDLNFKTVNKEEYNKVDPDKFLHGEVIHFAHNLFDRPDYEDSTNSDIENNIGKPERMVIEDDGSLISAQEITERRKIKHNKKYEKIYNFNKKYNNAHIYKVIPGSNNNQKQSSIVRNNYFKDNDAEFFSNTETLNKNKHNKHRSSSRVKSTKSENKIPSKSMMSSSENESQDLNIGDIDSDISKMLNSVNLFNNINSGSKINKGVSTTKKNIRYEVSPKDVEAIKEKMCKGFDVQKESIKPKHQQSKSYSEESTEDDQESASREMTTFNEIFYTKNFPRRSQKASEIIFGCGYKKITDSSSNFEDETGEILTSFVNEYDTSLQPEVYLKNQKDLMENSLTSSNELVSTYNPEEKSNSALYTEVSSREVSSLPRYLKGKSNEDAMTHDDYIPSSTSCTKFDYMVSENNDEEEEDNCNSKNEKNVPNKNTKKQRMNRVYLTINPILTDLKGSDKFESEKPLHVTKEDFQRARKKVKNNIVNNADDILKVSTISNGEDNYQNAITIQFVNENDDRNEVTPLIYVLHLDSTKKYNKHLRPNVNKDTTPVETTLISTITPRAELNSNMKKNTGSTDDNNLQSLDNSLYNFINMVPRTTPNDIKNKKCKNKSRMQKRRKNTTMSSNTICKGNVSTYSKEKGNNTTSNDSTTGYGNSVQIIESYTIRTNALPNTTESNQDSVVDDTSNSEMEMTDKEFSNENEWKQSNSNSMTHTITDEQVHHNFSTSATVYTDINPSNTSDKMYTAVASVIDNPTYPSTILENTTVPSKQDTYPKSNNQTLSHHSTSNSTNVCVEEEGSKSVNNDSSTTTECPEIVDIKEIANDAVATRLQQNEAASEASYKVREELANRANEAAETAHASVVDKQIIVNLLEELDSLFHLIRLLCSNNEESKEGYVLKQLEQIIDANDKICKIEMNLSKILRMITDLKEETIGNLECTKGRLLALRTKLCDEQKKLEHCRKVAEDARKCNKKKEKRKKKFRLFPWRKRD